MNREQGTVSNEQRKKNKEKRKKPYFVFCSLFFVLSFPAPDIYPASISRGSDATVDETNEQGNGSPRK
jgi:hypothetical protein